MYCDYYATYVFVLWKYSHLFAFSSKCTLSLDIVSFWHSWTDHSWQSLKLGCSIIAQIIIIINRLILRTHMGIIKFNIQGMHVIIVNLNIIVKTEQILSSTEQVVLTKRSRTCCWFRGYSLNRISCTQWVSHPYGPLYSRSEQNYVGHSQGVSRFTVLFTSVIHCSTIAVA